MSLTGEASAFMARDVSHTDLLSGQHTTSFIHFTPPPSYSKFAPHTYPDPLPTCYYGITFLRSYAYVYTPTFSSLNLTCGVHCRSMRGCATQVIIILHNTLDLVTVTGSLQVIVSLTQESNPSIKAILNTLDPTAIGFVKGKRKMEMKDITLFQMSTKIIWDEIPGYGCILDFIVKNCQQLNLLSTRELPCPTLLMVVQVSTGS